jgi:isochorismate pyruvate lyase
VEISDQETLRTLRREIDALDERIIGLLAERTALVDRVKVVKHDEQAVRSTDRVAQVLARVRGLAEAHGLDPVIAERTYATLIDVLTERQLDYLRHQQSPATPTA